MAVRKIKNSKSEGEKLEEDFNVRTVVEKTLKEVEVKGNEAVSYTNLTLPTSVTV